jgi:hypothetical protein
MICCDDDKLGEMTRPASEREAAVRERAEEQVRNMGPTNATPCRPRAGHPGDLRAPLAEERKSLERSYVPLLDFA